MNQNKHIVHVTDAVTSGVLIWLKEVCEQLDKRNWKLTLVYDSGRCEDGTLENSGLPSNVILFPMSLGRSLSPFVVINSIRTLSRFFKDIDPDVIHLHSSIAGGVGRVASLLAGKSKNTIYSPHGLAYLRQDVPWVVRRAFWLGEWFGAHLGGYGLGSSAGERDEMSVYYPKNKLYLIENSVDCKKVIRKKECSTDKLLIGTIGRITAQKAPESFAMMARSLGNKLGKFIWIGGGEQKGISVLTDSGVEVLGFLQREVSMEKLSDMDIYVSTALWEGMPLALIEAQMTGLPAVVSDVVGNRDIVIHGQTGFIASSQDEIDSYVRQLILDEDLRTELGKQAREIAISRFDIVRMIDSLESLYFRASRAIG